MVMSLQFVAIPNDDSMSIDNAVLRFDFKHLLAADIDIVSYGNAAGFVQRVGLGIKERFLDPSGYVTLINDWIWYAAQRGAVTLAEAKTIKNDYIGAVFDGRRQAPIAGWGYAWDARDAAVWIIVLQMGVGNWAAGDAYLAASWNGIYISTQLTGWQSMPSYGGGSYSGAVTTKGTVYSLAGAFSTGVIPIGGADEVVLNATQGSELLQAIANRMRLLNQTRVTKQNQVNVATTIPGVIAVDATGGWPA
jgi:hypothetical protein